MQTAINYEIVDQSCSNLDGLSDNIQGTLDTAAQQQNSLEGSWNSQAGSAYRDKLAKLIETFNGMDEALREGSKYVRTSAENFKQVDQNVQNTVNNVH